MKGNKNIIDCLNVLLADKLSVANQYIVHSEMCENWGYLKLQDSIKKRAIDEMHHVEKLISRILFLEGIPEIVALNKIRIGSDIEKQFKNDRLAEMAAIKAVMASIQLSAEYSDKVTRDLLETILIDEEKHLNWLEIQMEQIEQLGVKNYLLERIEFMEI